MMINNTTLREAMPLFYDGKNEYDVYRIKYVMK